MITASNLRDTSKINHEFLDFIDDYNSDEILLLIMGNSDNFKLNTRFEINKLGYIEDENCKAKVYNNADVMIFPRSMGDNCPLTILEAVSCGLPVVCYSNTGMTELINLLRLTELNYKPRLLDNLPKPKDEDVPELYSICKEYVQIYENC